MIQHKLMNTYCKYGIKSIGIAIEHSEIDINNMPRTFVQNTPMIPASAGTIKPKT